MASLTNLATDRKMEIGGVCLLMVAALVFLALATDSYQGDTTRPITDLGAGGSLLAGALYLLMGQSAHVVYLIFGVWGLMLIRHVPLDRIWTRILGTVLLLSSIGGLLHINFTSETAAHPGGIIGQFVAERLAMPAFGVMGGTVIVTTLAIIGLLLSTEFLFVRMLHWLYNVTMLAIQTADGLARDAMSAWSARERRERPAKEETITIHTEDAPPRRSWRELLGLLSSRKSRVRRAVQKVAQAHAERETAPAAEDSGLDRMRINTTPEEDAWQEDIEETEAELASARKEIESFASSRDEEPEETEQLELVSPANRSNSGFSANPVPEAAKPNNIKRLRRKGVDAELPHDYVYPRFYTKPSSSMFDAPSRDRRPDLSDSLRMTGKLLEETLETYGIEAKVTDITRGPTLTRFELEPAQGMKVSRFIALTDDLALALKAHGVRVEAPIPGKGKVGIEVPNDKAEAVLIRELLESPAYRDFDGPLALALGKDISGQVIAADLSTMPHLLVAGATGAGKTVCIKTILASLLVSRTPDELQLMLIDPKMVELSIFNDIPHLITPVVIDPRKASSSLQWLINEMEERYKLFAHLRVRNIEVYNSSVENGEIEVDGDEDDTQAMAAIRKLPYIVCVIDELADLMMLARTEVEDCIARLAQLARAVGIHLIIATQRPSVDVLTGVIKANFPARISFQVSSKVDSRCILDAMGAERLIGRGDMLYLPPGYSKPIRIQGAFVSDDETHDLIAYLKTQAPPQYRDEIENFGKQTEGMDDLLDAEDELFDDAVRIVCDTGQASISMVQRKLRVGYTRAARLIDMMEVRGIVGPHVGSKAREILVSAANSEEG